MNAPLTWTEAERRAWRPEEKLPVSEWAERHRLLPAKGTAEPGPLRLDRTPYLRELLDVLGDHEHTEVILLKSAQVGGTETARTAVGFWVDTAADDILLCLPDQASAQEYLSERIAALLSEPRLQRWVTDRAYDLSKQEIKLLHCSIKGAWTGSPQSMASRSIRFAVSDEIDKAQGSAREAEALDLIRDRLITFRHRSKHYILSTPTTKDGPIWREWERTADRRRYHVPCPHCGAEQTLEWARVRWDGRDDDETDERKLVRQADQLQTGELRAWILCEHCGEEIHEPHRLPAIQAGRWVSELGPAPTSRRVAFHISALYSPWVGFADLAAEYLRGRSKGDLRNFWNSFLGLPHEETTAKADASIFERRGAGIRPGIVPEWATLLTAGADTQASGQQAYWYYVVRAWGPGYRSRLIDWGRAMSEEQLLDATVRARWPVEGVADAVMRPLVCMVDSGGSAEILDGNTTELVYRLCRKLPTQLIPVKGASGRNRPDKKVSASRVIYQPQGSGKAPFEVQLHTLDVEHFKDVIANLIQGEDPVMWEENESIDDTYTKHMSTEEKVRVRVGKKWEVRWTNRTRRRVDLWDATVYAAAAAHMLQADARAHAVRIHTRPHRAVTPRPQTDHGRGLGGGGVVTPDGRPFLANRRTP